MVTQRFVPESIDSINIKLRAIILKILDITHSKCYIAIVKMHQIYGVIFLIDFSVLFEVQLLVKFSFQIITFKTLNIFDSNFLSLFIVSVLVLKSNTTLNDSNGIRTNNHLVCKRTLNHAKWLGVR